MAVRLNEACPEGILLVDKEEGKTSFDVVRMVKRTLKCKRTGHSGTLDPFASGLLVILLGQGTKLSPYIMGGKKKYRAEIRLGIETDTLDPTGTVINEAPVPDTGLESIACTIKRFTGVIEQVPPAFSALKVNGERAYKLARKGIEVELKKREVTVYSIDIIDVSLPLITLDVTCSAGTYIRSLAADIGKELGTVAHLNRLRRLSSGLFSVNDALPSKDLDPAGSEVILNRVIYLHESLPDMKTVNIGQKLAEKVRNGYRPSWSELTENTDPSDIYSGNIKLICDSRLIAVMEIDRSFTCENSWLMKIKVFN